MYLLLVPLLLAYHTVESNVRIIGGRDADIAEHPWQVSLWMMDTFVCAGSIVAPTWILTAAHCNLQQNYATIRAGSNRTDQGGVVVEVLDVIQNDGFSVLGMVDDIALVKLASPLQGSNIAAVGLPSPTERLSDGTVVNVAGWGKTNDTSSDGEEVDGEDVFREVEVPVVNVDECNAMYDVYNGLYEVTEYQFCAGKSEGGEGPCYGDSGGPAVVDGVVVGIVSWGEGCAERDYPAIYTKVSEYVEWIRSVIDEDGVGGF